MTTYYVDATLSTGDNDGSTTANAWRSLQEAIDSTNNAGKPAAGDIVLCRHTASPDETLTAKIDVDGTAGTEKAYIQWIGVNSSWTEDGTKYEINGNDAAVNCIDFSDALIDYTIWKHFDAYGATGNGLNMNVAGTEHHHFIDCVFRNNGNYGYYGNKNVSGILFGCLAYGNGGGGFYVNNAARALFCCSRDNTGSGFYAPYQSYGIFFNCLTFDNTEWGFGNIDHRNSLINCVSDNNGYGNINLVDYNIIILGCRITNAPATKYGIDANTELFFSGWNYFENNAGGNKLDAANEVFLSLINSTDTSQYDQADTNEGYTSLTEGSEDYNLRTDATGFSQAITIPMGQ
jgi:hypothetical protein